MKNTPKMKTGGWFRESQRHALAAKGVSTATSKAIMMSKVPINTTRYLLAVRTTKGAMIREYHSEKDRASFIKKLKKDFPGIEYATSEIPLFRARQRVWQAKNPPLSGGKQYFDVRNNNDAFKLIEILEEKTKRKDWVRNTIDGDVLP